MTDVPTCAVVVPFLRTLPPEVLAELGRSTRHRHLEKGEWLAGAGDPVDHLIVVARGRLKSVRASTGGREQVVRSLGPGEFFGELGLFAPAHHEGDLIAMEPSEVCLLGRRAIQDLMRHYPEAAIRLVEALAQRLAQAEQTIADLALRDVTQRLAAELLRASPDGPSEGAGARVRMPLPWVEVAARLGTTPESLSRRLRALAREGIIRQEGTRTVRILSPDRLRKLADG